MNAVKSSSSRILRLGFCAFLTTLSLAVIAQPPFRRPNLKRPLQGRPFANKPGKRNIDFEAVRLLKAMARTRVPYAGEQVTERGGRIARQQIWGDVHGRVRRDFLSPENMAGDVMLTAPENYRYFHKRENVQDVAFWQAGAGDELVEQVGKLLHKGFVSAARVGEETIAGRSATIVSVSADRLVGGSGMQIKFWIDKETGILLKREMSNSMGMISRSYMTSIQVGADAVPKAIFTPEFIGSALPRPLFPKESQFATVEEARSRLPFTPVQPVELPSGFRLTGVWVLHPGEEVRRGKISVLLRYSDGVTTFSLDQRVIPPGAHSPLPLKPKQNLRRPIQFWQANSSANDPLAVIYIGHLTPPQVQALRDSLK